MSKLLSSEYILHDTDRHPYAGLPSIELVNFEEGYKKEEVIFTTELILVLKSSFFLSYDHFLNLEIEEGKIILLPPGSQFTVRAEQPVSLLIFRVKAPVPFLEADTKEKDDFTVLDIKPGIEGYLNLLLNSMEEGLMQEEYLNLKSEELIYLMRSLYTKREFNSFFSPLLSPDSRFHHFVLTNHHQVKTVKELADRYRCSVSNFDKKFRRVFGMPPHRWMQQKKVTLLYREINLTDKPLRDIAAEQQFLSLSQFNDYCKKHFGYPPGKMRRLASLFHGEKQPVKEGK